MKKNLKILASIWRIFIRISTAYFSPAGFSDIAKSLANLSSIKILLVEQTQVSDACWILKCSLQKKLNESDDRFKLRKLREKEIEQVNSIRFERDNEANWTFPFNLSTKQALKQFLVESLRTGNTQVRRYEKNFLHAKAYIFASEKESNFDSIVAGSQKAIFYSQKKRVVLIQ